MKMFVFAIRDQAIQAYKQPFFLQAIGQAERMFGDLINEENKESDVWKHPEDFDLYKLGTYDDATGLFESDVPEVITRGKEIRTRQKVRAIK